MQPLRPLLFASLIALGACAPAGSMDGPESAGDDDVEASDQSLKPKCGVLNPCGGDGDTGGDGSNAPALSATYNGQNHRVTLNVANLPDTAFTIFRQKTIDWRCTGAARARELVGSMSSNHAGAASLVDNRAVDDDSEYYYFADYRNVHNVALELTAGIDTNIVQPRGQKFKIDGSTKHSVSVSWVDEFMTDDLFVLERKAGDDSSFSEVKRWPASSGVTCEQFSYEDVNLQGGSHYCYRLRIHTGLNHTGYSPERCTNTQELHLPQKPAHLRQINATDTTVTVAWDEPANDATRYILDNYDLAQDRSYLDGDTHTFTFTGMAPGGTYQLRVAAGNDDGTSEWATIEGHPTGTQAGACGAGGHLASYSFCQVCSSEIIPRTDTSVNACSEDQARQIAQNNAGNCSIEDGPC
jgi:hypothetical protein